MSSLTTSRVSLSPRKSYTEKPVPPVVQQALTLRPFATKDARRDLSTAHRAFVGAWDGLERCLVLSQSCRRLAERAAEVLLGVHEALNAVEQAQKGERVQVTKAYEFEARENALTVFKIQSTLIDVQAFAKDFSSIADRQALLVTGLPTSLRLISTLTSSLSAAISAYSSSLPLSTSAWAAEDATDLSADYAVLPRLFRLSFSLRGPTYEAFLAARPSAQNETGKRREEFLEWCYQQEPLLSSPPSPVSSSKRWTRVLSSPSVASEIERRGEPSSLSPTVERRRASEGISADPDQFGPVEGSKRSGLVPVVASTLARRSSAPEMAPSFEPILPNRLAEALKEGRGADSEESVSAALPGEQGEPVKAEAPRYEEGKAQQSLPDTPSKDAVAVEEDLPVKAVAEDPPEIVETMSDGAEGTVSTDSRVTSGVAETDEIEPEKPSLLRAEERPPLVQIKPSTLTSPVSPLPPPPTLVLRPATPTSRPSSPTRPPPANSTPPSATKPIRILCLDGGGIRGLTLLLTLKSVLPSSPPPCQQFDLITGVSTGALVAILLGRLRLDLDTATEIYCAIAKQAFLAKEPSSRSMWSKLFGSGSSAASVGVRDQALERACSTYLPPADLFDPQTLEDKDMCKTAVLAQESVRGQRWYRSDQNGSATLAEALRDSMATTPFFRPFQLQNSTFTTLTSSLNPSEATLDETRCIFGDRPISRFLSIGVGVPPSAKMSSKSKTRSLALVRQQAIGSRASSERFMARFEREGLGQAYRRVDISLQPGEDPGVEEWGAASVLEGAVASWCAREANETKNWLGGQPSDAPPRTSVDQLNSSAQPALRRSLSLDALCDAGELYLLGSGSTTSLT